MADKPHYAIMRIGKIHTRAVLDAVEWHNTRQIPARTVEGVAAPREWTERTGRYRDRADAILHETGATDEEGKILAVEMLLTTSPEWWTIATDEQKREWWKIQYEYAEHVFGPGLLAFTPHLDESTPHAQIVGLPLYQAIEKKRGRKPTDPEKVRQRLEEEANAKPVWRLSHDAVFGGGPKGLAARQTEYHGFVAHLGLSRGEDTVGKGVKHIPLKHYAQLLTQMDRDLKREAEELADWRAELQHYDDEVAAKHRKLSIDRAAFEKEQLDFYARQEEFRIRETDQVRAEADVATKERKLRIREDRVSDAEKRLDERECRIQQKEEAQAIATQTFEVNQRNLQKDQNRLSDERCDLDRREARVTEREQVAAENELQNVLDADAVRRREQTVERTLGQISIVTALLSGRLSGAWDASAQKPTIAKGELTKKEEAAKEMSWPPILAAALRHAAQMQTARSSIAAKVRKIMTVLRARRASTRQAENIANAHKAVATQRQREADDRIKEAKVSEERSAASAKEAKQEREFARSERVEADNRIDEADTLIAVTAERRTELRDLDGIIATAKAERSAVSETVSQKQSELAATEKEIQRKNAQNAALAAEKERLAIDKMSLQRVIASLTVQRSGLDVDRENVARMRKALNRDREVWDRSAAVWDHAVNGRANLERQNGAACVVVRNEKTANQIIRLSDLDPTVVAMITNKERQSVFEKELGDMKSYLTECRRQIATISPELKPELVKQEKEDDRRIAKMWEEVERAGQGL